LTANRHAVVALKEKELIRHVVVLTLVLGALYALCQNGCWLPLGSDDAFHLDIARNLALGRGLTSNGAPVIHTPPGFPALLASIMLVTPEFSILNWVLVFLLLGAVIMWYLVLRRYTSPPKALAVMLVVGILFEWHRFSYTYYTESLSYFLLGAAMLLAVQFGEGRSASWRVPLLALLCTAMVLANWRGLLSVILVCGALFTGQSRLSSGRPWAVLLLISFVSAATMFVTLNALESRAEHIRTQGLSEVDRELADNALKKQGGRLPKHLEIGPSEMLRRITEAGEWFSLLLWPPATAAKKWPASKHVINLLGWLLIVFLSVRVVKAVRTSQWIWVATAGFLAVLIIIRWYPLPRYFAPAAPLILLGIWDGLGQVVSAKAFARTKRMIMGCAFAGLISVVACNLAILVFQAWIVHSPDFHRKYLGGEYLDMLRISEHLKAQACGGGPVAVVARYADLNRASSGEWVERSLSFMTDCRFLNPGKRIRSFADPEFPGWAERFHLNYVVTRPDKLATRFWHFREPLLNLGGEPLREPFYVLFEIEGGSLMPVRLPRVNDGVRRVPGL